MKEKTKKIIKPALAAVSFPVIGWLIGDQGIGSEIAGFFGALGGAAASFGVTAGIIKCQDSGLVSYVFGDEITVSHHYVKKDSKLENPREFRDSWALPLACLTNYFSIDRLLDPAKDKVTKVRIDSSDEYNKFRCEYMVDGHLAPEEISLDLLVGPKVTYNIDTYSGDLQDKGYYDGLAKQLFEEEKNKI